MIGTQMVVKGLDFKNVLLVGVVDADHSLYFPDFRSFERTFQVLSQVAGRSGRFDERGIVFFQTKNPENSVIQAVIENDYERFYKSEIEDRENHGYPPFYKMIRITIIVKKVCFWNDAA